MPFTVEQKQEYVRSGGMRCPHCRSQHIESGPLQADGATAWAEVTCVDCGAEWTDEYTLTGMAERIAFQSQESN